jgi:hypothetical protein
MTGTTTSAGGSEVVSASVPTVRGASTTAIEDIATQLVVVRLSGVSTSCSVRW